MSTQEIPKDPREEIEKAMKAFDTYIPLLFLKHQVAIEEKDKEISDLEDADTTHSIEFEKFGTIHYKFEEGNLWMEQIMDNIEKIVNKKGTKYLLDRLDITIKAIEA